MFKESIFLVVGGLGLFLYGINLLSNGLQKASGNSFRKILETITKNSIAGIFLGFLLTVLIQSSSAVSVMTISFVNAGLFTLKQAITIIIGSNIGTTVTAWIVASIAKFNLLDFLLPLIGIGYILRFFIKNKKFKLIGEVMLGFGILFLGLDFMKEAGEPIKQSETIKTFLSTISNYPLLGILAGIIITIIVQSSSASIAIIQTMAWNGIINFEFSLAFILGANIGTTITGQIGSIGTNNAAKKTALANTIIKVLGTSYFIIFLYNGYFQKAAEMLVPGDLNKENIMIHIAAAHTLFNVINTIIFIPLINIITKLCNLIIKDRNEKQTKEALFLNTKLLSTPTLALEQVKKELIRMARICQKSFQEANKYLSINKKKYNPNNVFSRENKIDKLQSETVQYLIEIQERALLKEEAQQIPCYIHSINDLEKISDYIEDIVNINIKNTKINYRPQTYQQLKKIYKKINSLFKNIIESLYNSKKINIKSSYSTIANFKIIENEFRDNLINNNLSKNENTHFFSLHLGQTK